MKTITVKRVKRDLVSAWDVITSLLFAAISIYGTIILIIQSVNPETKCGLFVKPEYTKDWLLVFLVCCLLLCLYIAWVPFWYKYIRTLYRIQKGDICVVTDTLVKKSEFTSKVQFSKEAFDVSENTHHRLEEGKQYYIVHAGRSVIFYECDKYEISEEIRRETDDTTTKT